MQSVHRPIILAGEWQSEEPLSGERRARAPNNPLVPFRVAYKKGEQEPLFFCSYGKTSSLEYKKSISIAIIPKDYHRSSIVKPEKKKRKKRYKIGRENSLFRHLFLELVPLYEFSIRFPKRNQGVIMRARVALSA